MNFISIYPNGLPVGLFVFLASFLTTAVIAEWEYQRLARLVHNQYRTKHLSRSLYSTKELNRRAEKCALYYVKLGNIDHSCPYVDNAGENLYAYWGGNPTDSRVTLNSIDGWYDEAKWYKYRGQQSGTGHFTQVVWKSTKALGFGVARRRNMVVAVGLYWPPGNYLGEYTKNVQRPSYRRRYNNYG